MIFTESINIKAPIERVIECYTNDALRIEWDSSIAKKEPRGGIHLKVGANAMIYFKTPNGSQELYETILENKLPHSIKGLYQHVHMENTLNTRFESMGKEETKVSLDVDYFKTHKFIVKVFMRLFPGQFKKQVAKTMSELKAYAEQKY